MEKSEIRYQLWHSLEMRTLRRDILLFAVCLGLPWLITVSSEDTSGVGTLLGLFLLGILIFYIWRIISIFRHPEGYILAECHLTQPHSNPYLRSYYFTVRIELPNGRTDTVNTHAIFATHGIFEPIMEEYLNDTVWIAYNPSTGMVVVIG